MLRLIASHTMYRISLLFLALLLNSCVVPSVKHEERPQKPLVWPAPPMPARVSHIREIVLNRDITHDRGFWNRLKDFFTGDSPKGLIRPYGLTVDDEENLLIADPGAHRVHIYHLSDGKYRFLPHPKDDLYLISPIDVDVHVSGRIFVSDSAAKRVYIFDAQGRLEHGFGDFERPTGLAINNRLNRIYVVDTKAHRIRVYDPTGQHLYDFGERGGGPGKFNFPTNICLDQDGRIYITDSMNFRIQVFDQEGGFLYLFGQAGNGPGTFSKPRGIGVDSEGHIYLVDATFDNVQIFNSDGDTLLYFGAPGKRLGEFYLPAGLFIDNKDRIFLADSFNQRIQVFQYITEHEEFADRQELPSPILLLGVKGDSAYVIEKSTQTLNHFRKENDGIQLVHSYPLIVGKKTTEFFPPRIGKLPEGIFFSKNMILSDDRQLLLELIQPNPSRETSQIKLTQKEGEGVNDDAESESSSPPFPLVIQDGFSSVIGHINPAWTPFVVVKEITYSPEHQMKDELQNILKFIQDWENCWDELDLDCYIRAYSNEFKHEAMDRDRWKGYKETIFSMKTESQTTLKPIHIIQNGPWVLLTFLQDYRSPDYKDLGIKQIVIRQEGTEWKIFREEWTPYDVQS